MPTSFFLKFALLDAYNILALILAVSGAHTTNRILDCARPSSVKS
jgi:hypothetical protein